MTDIKCAITAIVFLGLLFLLVKKYGDPNPRRAAARLRTAPQRTAKTLPILFVTILVGIGLCIARRALFQ